MEPLTGVHIKRFPLHFSTLLLPLSPSPTPQLLAGTEEKTVSAIRERVRIHERVQNVPARWPPGLRSERLQVRAPGGHRTACAGRGAFPQEEALRPTPVRPAALCLDGCLSLLSLTLSKAQSYWYFLKSTNPLTQRWTSRLCQKASSSWE